jgi:preprotein translocase subunit SecA
MVFQRIVRAIGGDPNKRVIERLSQIVEEINRFEDPYEALSNEA